MCGVIGVIASPGISPASRVEAGLASLRHRGPNHQQANMYAVAGREVWLGHTRLSIIDLDSEANQPMYSEDGRYVMIFNGEIYNYIELRQELKALGKVFRTSSDTEVLLQSWTHWGDACLERLDGMFAFVVLDKLQQTITCVRDPFGIKPFFYALLGGAFYFASEMPAMLDLLPSKPHPDVQREYDYLVHGDYDSSDYTFVEGVRQLMPAHAITVDVASCSVRSMCRWWEPSVEQTSTLSFVDAAEAVREQFLLNIKRQLRSDVPLGAALSGGIDSSAVVCAMRHLEPDLPVHTFSFVASDSSISEERWVDVINQHVGAIPHKVRATADDLANDIDEMILAQGEPFGSTSIYAQYRVFKLAQKCGVTVTLDGQGADELLAGYVGYPGYRLLSYFSQGRVIGATQFARAWHRWPGRTYKSMALDVARATFPDAAYRWARGIGGRSAAPEWINTNRLYESGVRMSEWRPDEAPSLRGRHVVSRLRSSLQHRGLPRLLRHGDRNSMHFSIESRVPFLSRSLCELLYSLPEEFLISPRGETKSVFRAAMRSIVPDAILDRKDKVGFATPENAWLRRLMPVLHQWIKETDAVTLLDLPNTTRLLEGMLERPQIFGWQVWRLVNFARWSQRVFAA